MAGYPGAPYAVTKHAVVALSECLYLELEQRNSPVKVSVLCPGNVKTNIINFERNRPAALQNEPREIPPQAQEFQAFMTAFIEAGISPARVADQVFEAIKQERFYILTHPEFNQAIQLRMDSLLKGENPRNPRDAMMKLIKLNK